MSEVKVNKISPRTNCGTVTLGDSGDSITIPSGVTITNSGTAAGFGSTGEVSWNTTVKTGDFTATSGSGFFVNTAGGAVTVTLPSSPSAGNVVAVSDYNSTAGTNAITIARNGSNINGAASNLSIQKSNSAIQLVYVDSTTGWQNVTTANPSDIQETFIEATGGTITTSGNCKIHTFTGPGTFCVSSISGNDDNNEVSYVVVAGGGGGGGRDGGGGGGAGGFRESKSPVTPYTASPLDGRPSAPNRVTVTATAFPITVGGGGTAGLGSPSPGTRSSGGAGANSSFSTITAAGGGLGTIGANPSGLSQNGGNGGSGGGGGGRACGGTTPSGGTGNTPPVSPAQGTNGGAGRTTASPPSLDNGGGGGGATVAGIAAGGGNPGCTSGGGGTGATTHITGSPVAYAGGGGGGTETGTGAASPCGTGGKGAQSDDSPSGNAEADAGTTNRGGGGGGGGGGSGPANSMNGATGGSGIVIIRYKFQ